MYRLGLRQLIYLLSIFTVIILSSLTVSAQTPTPSPAVENTQETTPDKLKGVPEIAPKYRSDDRKLPDLGRVGVEVTEQTPMTLQDTLRLALENNKDIEVTRKNVRIAEFDFKAADGFYEPHFAGQSYYERAVSPVTSFFGGGPNGATTQSNWVNVVGLNGQLRGQGTQYRLDFNNSNLNTNNQFTTLNPLYTANIGASIVQPLFRGRRFDQPRRNIEIAKKNLTLTDTQFRQRTIEIIAAVQRAYWDLTFALRNLQIQRDAVRDAKDQLEHNKRLVEEGQLAPIDVVAIETQVANFELGVYDALDNVNRAENVLKGLVAPNKNDAIWIRALLPVDPVDNEVPVTGYDQALTAALQNRPEIQQNDIAKDINEIDQRFFRDQDKPQIDLTASYSLNGTAGSFSNAVNPLSGSSGLTIERINQLVNAVNQAGLPGTPLTPLDPPVQGTLPGNLTGGYGDVLGNIFANRYPTFRVGVNFNLPLFGNKTAKAQLGRSLVEGERIQTQREQLEQNIQIDVRNALQTLRTSEARLRSAAIARENSEKQYESEKRKADEGQSTIFLVLERQTALANARGAELRAQTELNKAIADLQRATGNSMTANNINVQPASNKRGEALTRLVMQDK